MKKALKVSTVTEGSQADQLGIKIGDILVSYNATKIYSNLDLSNAVYKAKNQKARPDTKFYSLYTRDRSIDKAMI